MQGIVWILFFYLLGCVVSALTGNFIPGSVVGMLLLFGALSAGWLRPWRMKRAAGFLLDNMMLFFIPVGVGLIASYSLVSKYLAAILVASIVSTVLVIVVVGMIEQKLEGKRREDSHTPENSARPNPAASAMPAPVAPPGIESTGAEPTAARAPAAMNESLSSQTFLLTLTLAVYLGSMWLYKKVRFALLHPLIVSMGVLILFLKLSGIPYDLFMKQIQIIDFMLGLSVVALGYLLHEQISQIKGNVIAIVTAIVTGSAVGILSVALIARAMGAEQAVIASLEPKSVTTAIALNVSAQSGGIPALTAVVVILVGIFGGVAGPFILKKIGVESKIAKGLAMGAAAHAMGTARAMQLGAVEGAISGLAIGLMGIATAILVPIIARLL